MNKIDFDNMKVWGPYVHRTEKNKGRKFIVVKDGQKTRAMFYSRWIMTKKICRWLDPSEEVDHIDEDRTNDSEDNLQILNRQKNAAKSAFRRVKSDSRFCFNCPVCNKPSSIEMARLRYRRKRGSTGPFCGKSCAVKSKWNSDNPPKQRKVWIESNRANA
jgi:hypothetical protein